jgi:hypothetical protein
MSVNDPPPHTGGGWPPPQMLLISIVVTGAAAALGFAGRSLLSAALATLGAVLQVIMLATRRGGER